MNGSNIVRELELEHTKAGIGSNVVVGLASEQDRERIYELRHAVYAEELGQHRPNEIGRLNDALDLCNLYIVAKIGGRIAGFISVTPPGAAAYSIDKYISRQALPFAFDDHLFEIRLLTVLKPHRGSELALLLMYSAFRWVEAHGGTRVVAIGRREVVDMYTRCGLQPMGFTVQSGAVTYDLLEASTARLRLQMQSFAGLLDRLESKAVWQLEFGFRKPAACFHGGAFFGAIGSRFDTLNRRHEVINADVLDAWFPPAPGVLKVMAEHLSWLLRTSPPTACDGMLETIAEVRGVEPANLLPGAGSSDLIFRAFRHWLGPSSQALILHPTYGEYAHVLDHVVGCTTDRLELSPGTDYRVDLELLGAAMADGYDLIVLVNPNSPTGAHIPRAELVQVLKRAPERTRVWVDETYVEYAGPDQSLEQFAARSENIIVCKSMSKVYALSGVRVAYLCAGEHQLEALRSITPPWVVGLPGQVAAVQALQDPQYYASRYAETSELRAELGSQLVRLGLSVVPGVINCLLCRLPSGGPNAATIAKKCRERNLFIRDTGPGTQLGSDLLRIAVKDQLTNQRIHTILADLLASQGCRTEGL